MQAARRYSRKLRGIVPVSRSPPQPALGYTPSPGHLPPGSGGLLHASVDLPPGFVAVDTTTSLGAVDMDCTPGDEDMDLSAGPFIQSLSSER